LSLPQNEEGKGNFSGLNLKKKKIQEPKKGGEHNDFCRRMRKKKRKGGEEGGPAFCPLLDQQRGRGGPTGEKKGRDPRDFLTPIREKEEGKKEKTSCPPAPRPKKEGEGKKEGE